MFIKLTEWNRYQPDMARYIWINTSKIVSLFQNTVGSISRIDPNSRERVTFPELTYTCVCCGDSAEETLTYTVRETPDEIFNRLREVVL